MPFSVALRVLPGAVQASLVAGAGVVEAGAAGSAEQAGGAMGQEAAKAAAAAGGVGGGLYGQVVRALPLLKVGMLMMAYVKLLTVKNGQLEDDVRILKGLKVRAGMFRALDKGRFTDIMRAGWLAGWLAPALFRDKTQANCKLRKITISF